MTRVVVLGASALLWGVMMASLFRREVLPYFEYQAPPSYRDVLKDIQIAELTKGRIEAAGVPVGRIETLAERLFDGTYRLRTVATMNARILGSGTQATSEIPLSLKSETSVDVLYRFRSTWCEIDAFVAAGRIEAVRDGDLLRVRVGTGDVRLPGGLQQTLEFPKEGLIGDLFQPFPGGGALYIGKKWKIPTMSLGATGLGMGWLYASVTDRERILWQDAEVDTFRVEIRTEPTEEKRPTHISWCRADGVALKQQMTFQSLVYDIVFVSRSPAGRGEAIGWGRRHFGAP